MRLDQLFTRLLLSVGTIPAAVACGGLLSGDDPSEESVDASQNDNKKKTSLTCESKFWDCSDGVRLTQGTPDFAERSGSCAGTKLHVQGECGSCGQSFAFCGPTLPFDATQCGDNGPPAIACLKVERQVPCGLSAADASAVIPREDCIKYCGGPDNVVANGLSCRVSSEGIDSGTVLVCDSFCGGGRRPSGLIAQEARGAGLAGRILAKMVELEAASVDAFEILGRELAHYGAPSRLLRRIEVARRDELRHARVMATLAKRRRGVPIVPQVERSSEVRPLALVAEENAVEGCVRETFGALLAHYQAAHARDEDVKLAMRGIARDETRHAELSWTLFAWCNDRLGREDRRTVETAFAKAVRDLESENVSFDAEASVALGLPSPEVRGELLAKLTEELLSSPRPIAA